MGGCASTERSGAPGKASGKLAGQIHGELRIFRRALHERSNPEKSKGTAATGLG